VKQSHHKEGPGREDEHPMGWELKTGRVRKVLPRMESEPVPRS